MHGPVIRHGGETEAPIHSLQRQGSHPGGRGHDEVGAAAVANPSIHPTSANQIRHRRHPQRPLCARAPWDPGCARRLQAQAAAQVQARVQLTLLVQLQARERVQLALLASGQAATAPRQLEVCMQGLNRKAHDRLKQLKELAATTPLLILLRELRRREGGQPLPVHPQMLLDGRRLSHAMPHILRALRRAGEGLRSL